MTKLEKAWKKICFVCSQAPECPTNELYFVADALHKYEWHDLRKNPKDLPTKDGEYLIEFEFGNQIKYAVREYVSKECAWGCTVVPIAWKEIEPSEAAEE